MDDDLTMMNQSPLTVARLAVANRTLTGGEMMSAIIRFVRLLETSEAAVLEEMQGQRRPEKLLVEINKPISFAIQMAADPLLQITRDLQDGLSRSMAAQGQALDAEATAAVLVWLDLARSAREGSCLLFQLANLYGRAPNGRSLRENLPSDAK